MNIGSFQKISLQDYPDKISAICFTKGCNLRCPYCHNPDLVINNVINHEDKTRDFINYLNKRKNMLEGVVISGGEPLIHNDLIDLIYKIKKLNLKIKLDTNGMLPDKLKYLLEENLIDYIALDYKGSSESICNASGTNILTENNSTLTSTWFKSLNFIIEYNIDYEIRTTVVKEIHKVDDLVLMANELKDNTNEPIKRWFLQSFEKKTDILEDFNDSERNLSSYSTNEMIEIEKNLKNIISQVSFRN